jgi:kexin
MDGLDGDPFFQYQWYIKSLGTDIVNTAAVSTIIGNDLNILNTYHYVVGTNGTKEITIQVIDSGVQAHEDLKIDLTLSLNAVNHTNNPAPTKALSGDPYSPADVGHGNAVSGIIAARTNNGLGIRGLVPYAKIAGSNWLEDAGIIELEKVWYSQINSSEILVSNNSWGTYVLQDFTYEEILAHASTELRNSKGRVFVFASGNFRKDFGNANLSYLSNNPYAITVASLNHKDSYAIYSNPGSNILVSAYGGEYYYVAPTIMSTLLMGKSYYESELIGKKGSITIDEDSNRNYTYVMNGTSAAAPMVSAAIALTLEACPSLTYRDIKWILANTSKKIDILNPTWIQNSAGLWHNIDYGYGKVDALAMVELCRSKYFRPLSPLKIESASLLGINKFIPDTNTSVVTEIYFDKELKVEWVGLTLDIDHPFAGDLEINLISPQGTKTTIMTLTETRYNAYNGGFRFGSVAFVDEDALGIWKVEIIDRLTDDSGTLKSIKLEIHGYEEGKY